MAQRDLLLLIDGETVSEWQRRALETLPNSDRITIYSCTNTRLRRQVPKHLLYYCLNLFTVRNPLTKFVPVGDLGGRVVAHHMFESEWDGNWQRLPDAIIDQMAGSKAAAVIKFGLGLMRVPDALKIPILSYHHGDPDRYRGRPAGYYEMANREPRIGQIVQQISNKLDAGTVLAFAETRVMAHSWRATLIESFRHSPYLLRTALDNVASGRTVDKKRNGKNYRLPGNLAVLAHVWRTLGASVRRLGYGLFFEKYWRVSTLAIAGSDEAVELVTAARHFAPRKDWRDVSTPSGFSFLADPFFAPGGGILLEAMNAKTGKGAIVHCTDDSGAATLSTERGHHSYPAVVAEDGQHYCIPEVAEWSAPLAYLLEAGDGGQLKFGAGRPLRLPEAVPLTDPTFFRHNGKMWLFANRKDEGSNILRLWFADSLFADFVEHPASPIRVSCHGGRMAGNLVHQKGRLYRLGQLFDHDYGNGVVPFEVETLDESCYMEREAGLLQFSDCKGPHTFNHSADGKQIVFDWYSERFTPMAGIRRIRSRLGF